MTRMVTLLSGAVLGASAMYLMDPERGHRRRAGLREALAEVGDTDLVERARRLEPLTTVREIGGGLLASRWPVVAALASRGRGRRPRMIFGRRRAPLLHPRDWALLGGFVGAIVAGLWLVRRSQGAEQGIEVSRTMTVDAPVERVFEFWNDFENFPRFMSHVREVRRTGPDRSHWVVAGPGGVPIEWDAAVTQRVANEVISSRTVEGTLVDHSGTVRFWPTSSGATRIEISMTYRPVGGALGHGVATLFGSDPERVIGDDLSRVAAQLRGPRPAVGETGQWR